MKTTTEMRGRILDAAHRLVQTVGYNAFSYADIAEAVGIRKASIHHYFPARGDLGLRLVERFRAACRVLLGEIERNPADPFERLEGCVQTYRVTPEGGGCASAGCWHRSS